MPPENAGAVPGSQYPKSWFGGRGPYVKWAPAKIGDAASILEKALETLAGTGALNNVQSQGILTAAELGNWDAGQELARTTQAAHEHITAVFQDFIQQYAAAIQTLRKTAANYSGTEEDLTKHARRIAGQEQPSSAKTPTWHNVPSAD
jgi:hypothetical protein